MAWSTSLSKRLRKNVWNMYDEEEDRPSPPEFAVPRLSALLPWSVVLIGRWPRINTSAYGPPAQGGLPSSVIVTPFPALALLEFSAEIAVGAAASTSAATAKTDLGTFDLCN
jgi:hypothetical protein